jgi:hypothetical protein
MHLKVHLDIRPYFTILYLIAAALKFLYYAHCGFSHKWWHCFN